MKSFTPVAFLFALPLTALATPGSGTVILDEKGAITLGIETVKVERADFEITSFALGKTDADLEEACRRLEKLP